MTEVADRRNWGSPGRKVKTPPLCIVLWELLDRNHSRSVLEPAGYEMEEEACERPS